LVRHEVALRLVAVLAVPATLVAAGAALAGADSESRQSARTTFTDERPDESTGLRLKIDYVNPDDPDGKPPAVRRVVTTLRHGTRIDTSVPKRCKASDAELMADGPGACPKSSRVGDGEIDLDTGTPGPNRFVENDLTLINNKDELIFLTESTNTPTTIRAVARAIVEGRKTISEVPPIPGTPPPDPFTALDRVRAKIDADSERENGERKNYITTPDDCPRDGDWMNRARFTYRDDVSQKVKNRSACRR